MGDKLYYFICFFSGFFCSSICDYFINNFKNKKEEGETDEK